MTKAITHRFTAAALAFGVLTAIGASHTQAQTPTLPTSNDASVTFRVSTLGLGPELGKQVGSHFALRAGLNNYSLSRSASYQSVAYNTKLKLSSISALGDFYPTKRGSFHLTGGLVINNNTLDGVGTPSGMDGTQTFTINGQTYTVNEVGALNGHAAFHKYAPYLGFGFGRPGSGGTPLRLLLDIGVVFQGKANLSLTATGAAADPSLASDIQIQREKTQSDLNKFQLYPVVSVGLAYHY